MKFVLANYNFTPSWLKEYTDDYLLYDQSENNEYLKDFDQSKIIKSPHIGDADKDKLSYLIDHYDTLPEIFVWGKTNLFKYVEEDTLKKALEANLFAPLIRQDHRIYRDAFSWVNKWDGKWYYERADSWFFNATRPKYFHTWQEWCSHFGLPQQNYIPFAPGGNYLLTRERVHRYSRDFYADMRSTLTHAERPAEAQAAERSYGYLWR